MDIDALKAMDLNGLPAIAGLQDDLQRSLWALLLAKVEGSTPSLSSAEVSRLLREIAGLNVHWRTIQALLLQNPELVSRAKRGPRWWFSIMRPGEDLLTGKGDIVRFIDPTQAYTATRGLHSILAASKGTVRICDPYADATALDHLTSVPTTCDIRWLSSNVHSRSALRQELAAFSTQYCSIDLRLMRRGILHDRYIIDDSRILLLGCSLNGFGKSQSFIVSLGEDIRLAMLQVFDSNWNSASVLV